MSIWARIRAIRRCFISATAYLPSSIARPSRRRSLTPSTRSGPIKFNITNFGQDTHNFVIKGPKRFIVAGPDVEPGSRASISANLRRPGTYYLLCTRANHSRLGMKAKLTVRR